MEKPIRVLILEDAPADAELIMRKLRKGGIRCDARRVETKEAFIENLNEFKPDIILADYNLPSFDGPAAISIAKRDYPDLPIILISGTVGEDIAVEILKHGAWDYILKDRLSRLVPSVLRALKEADDLRERKRLQEALWTSAREWRATFDAVSYPVALMDLNRNIRRCNKAMAKLLGKPFNEIIDRNCCEFVHGRPDPIEGCPVERLRESSSRETLRCAVGQRWFDATADPLLDEAGRLVGAVHIMVDITDQKLSEETLRKSEEEFRKLFDHAPVGYLEYTLEGRITRVNRTELEMLGYTREEMIGQPVWGFNIEEGIARQHVLEKLAGLRPPARNLDRTYRRKDGTLLPVLIEDRLILEENGRIIGIRCTIQDITDRKQVEANLRRSEENARQLAQANAIMAEIGRIISSTLNIDEIYEIFSGEAKKLIPFDRIVINIIDAEKNTVKNVYIAGEGVRDRNTRDVYPVEGSGNAEMLRTKSTLLIQAEDFSEYQDRLPMLFSTFQAGFRSIMNVPLFSKGEIIGGLLLRSRKPYAYTDMDVRVAERIGLQIAGAIANAQLYADRIRAEEEKAALEEQLRQSQKMEAIGRLAGGIAHDFNNLLTVISGYSQLSLNEIEGEGSLKENTKEIQIAAQRAATLTRQLLAFSRRQVMEMKVLDLNELVKNLDKILRRVLGEDIELVTLLAAGLGRAKVDPGQIEQVIMNLAVNARDAMPSGGKLTIETTNAELDEEYARAHANVTPGRYVMLSVSDTGVGMSSEVKERAFEPFFTTKGKDRGTGLGLSTVYGIVKQSGGNIWIYSEPGQGTTFKIYLPMVDEPLEEPAERVTGEELPRGSETILVVEDEEKVRDLTVRLLERQGYKVLGAPCGDDTVVLCEQYEGPIHLLLTDVVMPGMSGRQLAQHLASVRPGIKVLYMSGYTDNAIVHHGILEPGKNYIQKPFTMERLARKVREVLDK